MQLGGSSGCLYHFQSSLQYYYLAVYRCERGPQGQIIKKLEDLKLTPVLVGGMALVILSSQRVMKDFNLLVHEEARNLEQLVKIFYFHGLELVSKINK